MNQENNEVITIDLMRIVNACLRKWWIILFAALICGTGALLSAKYYVKPTYQSVTKIYVNSSEISLGNISISAKDISASNSVVDVYLEILNTKKIMDIISEKSGLSYTHTQMMGMINAVSSNDTPVLKITVTSYSQDEAQLIASTISKVLPDAISETIMGAYTVVIDDAYPLGAITPNYAQKAAVGAMIGALIVIIIIALIDMFSSELISEEDIHDITDIPIIGHISDFGTKEKVGRYNRYYYRSSDKKTEGSK